MEVNSIPTDQLLERCQKKMQEYGLSNRTIQTYMTLYRHLHSFMKTNGIEKYIEEVGTNFCSWFKSDDSRSDHSKHLAMRVTALLRLIVNDLPYEPRYSHTHKDYEFRGEIGEAAQMFISSLSNERLSERTIYARKYILSLFSIGMANKGINIANIKEDDLVSYICSQQSARVQIVTSLRLFFRYLYDNHLITKDLSKNLKSIKRSYREKIVSFYSEDEIAEIERSIERKTKNGKRNYAMVLLASRLGLRASDVAGLKFSEIDWENCTITRKQCKTGRTITLPLLSDVGEAIIDYILNARPKTNGIDSVFVNHKCPYKPCSSIAFTNLVRRIISRSTVSSDGRHSGAHCLRHSLATALMNDGVEFPIISEVLGHKSVLSTTFYLGVSVKSLLDCSLEVPIVQDDFYTQKGGEFYE